jgi:aspartyl-tRNA synthetase
MVRDFFHTNIRAYLFYTSYTGLYPARTHSCGSLSAEDVGKSVTLAGWIQPARYAMSIILPFKTELVRSAVSKHLSFFTIKDGDGQTQLLVRPLKSDSPDAVLKLDDVPVESVVLVEGKVVVRPGSSKRTVI